MTTLQKSLVLILVLTAAGSVLLLKARQRSGTHDGASVEPVMAEGTGRPRLLELGADKCVPCKMMAPILAELKTAYAGQMDVDFIDVWEQPEAAEPYGIRVIPVQLFFDAQGQERFRHEGFFSKEDILAKWTELGIEFK